MPGMRLEAEPYEVDVFGDALPPAYAWAVRCDRCQQVVASGPEATWPRFTTHVCADGGASDGYLVEINAYRYFFRTGVGDAPAATFGNDFRDV